MDISINVAGAVEETTVDELFLYDSRHQDMMFEICTQIMVMSFFSAKFRRQKMVTYGNYEADDVDIFVPAAGVAVPVGLQGFSLGDRVNRASEFLRAGFGMDGFSDSGGC